MRMLTQHSHLLFFSSSSSVTAFSSFKFQPIFTVQTLPDSAPSGHPCYDFSHFYPFNFLNYSTLFKQFFPFKWMGKFNKSSQTSSASIFSKHSATFFIFSLGSSATLQLFQQYSHFQISFILFSANYSYFSHFPRISAIYSYFYIFL